MAHQKDITVIELPIIGVEFDTEVKGLEEIRNAILSYPDSIVYVEVLANAHTGGEQLAEDDFADEHIEKVTTTLEATLENGTINITSDEYDDDSLMVLEVLSVEV